MAPLMLERAERTGKPVYARDVIEPAIEIMDRTYTFTIDITAPCVSIFLFFLSWLNIFFSLTAERRLSQAQLWAALENRRFDLFRDRLKRVAYFTVGLAAVHTVKFMVAGGVSFFFFAWSMYSVLCA